MKEGTVSTVKVTSDTWVFKSILQHNTCCRNEQETDMTRWGLDEDDCRLFGDKSSVSRRFGCVVI